METFNGRLARLTWLDYFGGQDAWPYSTVGNTKYTNRLLLRHTSNAPNRQQGHWVVAVLEEGQVFEYPETLVKVGARLGGRVRPPSG